MRRSRGIVNHPVILHDPRKPVNARVALSDRIRGDQARSSLLPQQVKCSTVKMGDQVRVAVSLRCMRLKASRDTFARALLIRVPPANGGLPTIRIEAAVLAAEHFRKLDLPMKRLDGLSPESQFLRCFWLMAFGASSSHRHCRTILESSRTGRRVVRAAGGLCQPRRKRRMTRSPMKRTRSKASSARSSFCCNSA